MEEQRVKGPGKIILSIYADFFAPLKGRMFAGG